MSYTMLQLVQQVTNELGVSTPTYVATNTNQDVIQILALMNASGYELLRKHPWQALTKQKQFYTEYLTTTGNWTTASRVITGIPSTTQGWTRPIRRSAPASIRTVLLQALIQERKSR
jgi:hypothetical protein